MWFVIQPHAGNVSFQLFTSLSTNRPRRNRALSHIVLRRQSWLKCSRYDYQNTHFEMSTMQKLPKLRLCGFFSYQPCQKRRCCMKLGSLRCQRQRPLTVNVGNFWFDRQRFEFKSILFSILIIIILTCTIVCSVGKLLFQLQ